jgi:hypothetical protein
MITDQKTRYHYFDDKGQHLHTLDGRPLLGTTSIMNVLAKPLTWWASGMACAEFGWIHEKNATSTERLEEARNILHMLREMDVDTYLAKLDKAYRAHDKVKHTAAGEGHDVHARCERYVLNCMNINAGRPIPPPEGKTGPVAVFARWACDNVERFRWAEAHCYSETLWVGGISDCGATLKPDVNPVGRPTLAIIDFKRSKAAYFNHFVQLAGYAYQIAENGLFTAEGVNIVEPQYADTLIVFPFGGGKPQQEKYSYNYKTAFADVVHLYQMQRDFDQT